MKAASGTGEHSSVRGSDNGGNPPAAVRLSIRVDDDLRRRIKRLKSLSGQQPPRVSFRSFCQPPALREPSGYRLSRPSTVTKT